jgi:hypothetical protein
VFMFVFLIGIDFLFSAAFTSNNNCLDYTTCSGLSAGSIISYALYVSVKRVLLWVRIA